jgi:hypothetical protein
VNSHSRNLRLRDLNRLKPYDNVLSESRYLKVRYGVSSHIAILGTYHTILSNAAGRFWSQKGMNETQSTAILSLEETTCPPVSLLHVHIPSASSANQMIA